MFPKQTNLSQATLNYNEQNKNVAQRTFSKYIQPDALPKE
jgi:hypothetical protein